MKKSANKLPLDTRGRILQAAFVEFYVNGFQGGGINNIIEKAASTKGALFHHFPDKQALGYAVVDEEKTLVFVRSSELVGYEGGSASRPGGSLDSVGETRSVPEMVSPTEVV